MWSIGVLEVVVENMYISSAYIYDVSGAAVGSSLRAGRVVPRLAPSELTSVAHVVMIYPVIFGNLVVVSVGE